MRRRLPTSARRWSRPWGDQRPRRLAVTELLLGLGLGLGAGISPGPLQTLVVTSTLRHGFGAGARIAIAPLLTDVPIVVAAVAAVSAVPVGWVRVIAIAGGVVLAGMGTIEMVHARTNARHVHEVRGPGRDMLKGAVVNFLNPHPWIFWIGVGAPILVTAWRATPGRALAYLAGFYVTIVGAKLVIAGVVAAGRQRLSVEWRYRLLLIGGALLVAFGLLLAARAF